MGSDLKNNMTEFEVVLQHYDLLENSYNYKIVCPFHADINPSMVIDIERQSFYCFGCGKAGGAYEFVKFMNEGKSPLKIAREFSKIMAGNGNSRRTSVARNSKLLYSNNKKLNITAVKDYYYNLENTNWYDTETEEEYNAKSYLKKRGYKTKTLVDAGCKFNEDSRYPIIFPILDNGIFRGYIKRTMSKRIEKKKKYLYNTGFRRAKTLCGEYENDSVMIVEGLLDKLKANQFGVKFVAATLGWKPSERQIQKLKRKGVKRLLIATDADEAGRKAYKFWKTVPGFDVKRLHYPKGINDMGDVDRQTFNKRLKKQIERFGNLL